MSQRAVIPFPGQWQIPSQVSSELLSAFATKRRVEYVERVLRVLLSHLYDAAALEKRMISK